jgi:predicted PurR-regulated permease PerM
MIKNQQLVLPPHINVILVFFGLIMFFTVLSVGSGILIPLAFGFLLSIVLFPLCKRLEAVGVSRSIAIIICLLVIFFVIVIFFTFAYSNIVSFADDFPQMIRRIQNLITIGQKALEDQFHIDNKRQLVWLRSNLDSFVQTGGIVVNNLIQTMTTFVSYVLFIPVYIFFMLYYRHVFKGFIHRIVKHSQLEKAEVIEEAVLKVVQKYIVGLFTVIGIVAVLNIIGLSIIGIKHAFFFGMLAAFLTIIPYIGVFIGSLLPIVYATAMYDSLFYPIAVLIWFQIVQALEGNFITPNVIGSQVNLNPMVAILAFVTGSALWGVPGMILFVPFTAILKVTLDNIPTLSPYGYLLSEGNIKSLDVKKRRFWSRMWRKAPISQSVEGKN